MIPHSLSHLQNICQRSISRNQEVAQIRHLGLDFILNLLMSLSHLLKNPHQIITLPIMWDPPKITIIFIEAARLYWKCQNKLHEMINHPPTNHPLWTQYTLMIIRSLKRLNIPVIISLYLTMNTSRVRLKVEVNCNNLTNSNSFLNNNIPLRS